MPVPSDPEKAKYMFMEDMKFLQKVIIFHPYKNIFLALHRSQHDSQRPNDWDLPGGNVTFGENHEAALTREVKEETQLSIHSLRPAQVVTNFDANKGLYYLFIGYTAIAENDSVTIDPQEHSEYRWVSNEEFFALTDTVFLRELVDDVYAAGH